MPCLDIQLASKLPLTLVLTRCSALREGGRLIYETLPESAVLLLSMSVCRTEEVPAPVAAAKTQGGGT